MWGVPSGEHLHLCPPLPRPLLRLGGMIWSAGAIHAVSNVGSGAGPSVSTRRSSSARLSRLRCGATDSKRGGGAAAGHAAAEFGKSAVAQSFEGAAEDVARDAEAVVNRMEGAAHGHAAGDGEAVMMPGDEPRCIRHTKRPCHDADLGIAAEERGIDRGGVGIIPHHGGVVALAPERWREGRLSMPHPAKKSSRRGVVGVGAQAGHYGCFHWGRLVSRNWRSLTMAARSRAALRLMRRRSVPGGTVGGCGWATL